MGRDWAACDEGRACGEPSGFSGRRGSEPHDAEDEALRSGKSRPRAEHAAPPSEAKTRSKNERKRPRCGSELDSGSGGGRERHVAEEARAFERLVRTSEERAGIRRQG